LARSPGRLPLLHFALQTIADWFGTTVRERLSTFWSAGRPHARRSSVTEWAVTLLLYLFVTTTLVQAYVVPTGSMEGNLLIGDHMFVDRLAYSDPGPLGRHILPYRDVERGDIIAFLYPEDFRQTYVKRVIGLAGDRIHLENGRVVRNGLVLVEPYTQHIGTFLDPYRDNFPTEPDRSTSPRGCEMFKRHVRDGEVTVPPGMIFAMGDNRENSLDSRYWGFVPREYVVGKPLLVYWSYDAPTADLQEWTVDHVIDVAQHFFTRTRWKRTLFVPRSQPAREIGGTR
ncbi:MAG TPA: signal peptidase I, partial [Tepidisphaeraceae bacterium]|nr:signal peptidase I [Tepidisphaeraceae bacterium]